MNARRRLAWLCALGAACAGEGSRPRGAPVDAGADAPAGPLADDDSDRLGHCAFEAPPPREARPAIAPAAFRAGYATRDLALPLGSPLGGYGARSKVLGGSGSAVDARARRFVTSFVPTAGQHDALRADALALEAGGERVVFVRLDLPVMLDTTLFAVERAAAADGALRGRIVLTASHSHASWAGWPPSLVLVPGMDRPSRALHDLLVPQIAAAVTAALAALEPARVGFAAREDLDPASEVSHDRRASNDDVLGPDGNDFGKAKDPVTWAIRVDRADGSPLAALLSVPLHGTLGGEANPVVSTDAPGAVQRALTAELGYPVLHVQGAAGDVSPDSISGRAACPDEIRCLDYPALEAVGARAVDKLAGLVRDVTTHDALALEVVTRSFPVGKSRVVRRPDGRELYYPPYDPEYVPDGLVQGADGALLAPLDEFNTRAGAALCGTMGGSSFGPIEGTQGVGAYASCADLDRIGEIFLGLFKVKVESFVAPLCETARATATALRLSIGGDAPVLVVTAPGEPTAPFTEYLRGRSPAGRERTLVVGYGQDYAGYLLTAEDWLTGDYEASLNVWGPLEGEQIIDGILEAAALAFTPELEDPEAGASRPPPFVWPGEDPLVATVDDDAGAVPAVLPATLFLPDTVAPLASAQPAPTVERVRGVARLVWAGGDPLVDAPVVTVEREVSPGSFTAFVGATGVAASSREGAVVLTYTPDPLDAAAPDRHLWAASWQPVPPDPLSTSQPGRPYALPLGRYRLVARGTALGSSGPFAYDVSSAPFEVVAASLGAATATRDAAAGGLRVTALLGSAPGLRALRRGVSDAELPLPGPWALELTLAGGGTATATVAAPGGGSGVLVTTAPHAPADVVSIDVRDPSGNGGTIAVE
ncbi:MAG: hypothetical protein IT376_15100 [Polyangiaceae bacterium]|nr:hypothetical protein [Polyangiaceae bacterium]